MADVDKLGIELGSLILWSMFFVPGQNSRKLDLGQQPLLTTQNFIRCLQSVPFSFPFSAVSSAPFPFSFPIRSVLSSSAVKVPLINAAEYQNCPIGANCESPRRQEAANGSPIGRASLGTDRRGWSGGFEVSNPPPILRRQFCTSIVRSNQCLYNIDTTNLFN